MHRTLRTGRSRPARGRRRGWIEPALALGFAANGVRLRRRLAALARITARPDDPPVASHHRFVTAAGVELDETTRRAVSRFAEHEGLQAVDLVPADLPVERLLDVGRAIDARRLRGDPFTEAASAGHAVLIDQDLVERAELDPSTEMAPLELIELVRTAKRYAPRATDVAVAEGLVARRGAGDLDMAIIRAKLGGAAPLVTLGGATMLGVLGRALVRRRPWGVAAVVAHAAQPVVAVAGTDLRPRGLWARSIFRMVGLARDLVRLNVPPPPPPDHRRRRAGLRDAYQQELTLDRSHFFQPRRLTCPLCGSDRLRVHARAADLLQCKPGEFAVDVCQDCGHLFQNPQLTPAGLDFYYRDFYDGEGADTMDGVFSSGPAIYEKRARMVDGLIEPTRWLDVGTGHGHFCLAARAVHPDTTFDGLDLSESIEEASRTGWVDHGHRGLFPEVAPRIEGRYDVVSMFHYLEHTTDPAAEISAAAQALEPGGLLVIEVPNPESHVAQALGKWWGPLMQPQHLNLVSMGNLIDLLRDNDLEPVRRIGPAAHQPCDLVFGLFLLLNRLGPPVDMPWLAPSTRLDRLRHGVVWWTLGPTALPLAAALDQVIAPILRRTGSHSAYRVVARKGPASGLAQGADRVERDTPKSAVGS